MRSRRARSISFPHDIYTRNRAFMLGQIRAASRRSLAGTRDLFVARVRYRSPAELRHTSASAKLSRKRSAALRATARRLAERQRALEVYARWMPQEPPAATRPGSGRDGGTQAWPLTTCAA